MILGRRSPEEGSHAGRAEEPDRSTEPPINENAVLTELKPATVLGMQMPQLTTTDPSAIRADQSYLQLPCKI